jgi:hypothetical protein
VRVFPMFHCRKCFRAVDGLSGIVPSELVAAFFQKEFQQSH